MTLHSSVYALLVINAEDGQKEQRIVVARNIADILAKIPEERLIIIQWCDDAEIFGFEETEDLEEEDGHEDPH